MQKAPYKHIMLALAGLLTTSSHGTHWVYLERDSRDMRKEVEAESVELVVTSPPYWNLKDYGNRNQIGYHDDLDDYIRELGKVWDECIRVLRSGCRMCINIGDLYLRAKESHPYRIVPLHAYLVNDIMTRHKREMFYLGSIIWQKIPTTKTTGGASVMGSYGRPRNGYVSYNYEYIAIFRKQGEAPAPDPEIKRKTRRIRKKEWRKLFNGIWKVKGERQVGGIAIFPPEIPRRLMRMFTYEGDTVLDPFLGSGTTTKVAWEDGRNSIGYEIGFSLPDRDWREIIKEKIHFNEYEDCNQRRMVFPTLEQTKEGLANHGSFEN